MAKYRLGNQPFYRMGVMYDAGSTIELHGDPDQDPTVAPSHTWEALDGEARRHMKKLEKRIEDKWRDAQQVHLAAPAPAPMPAALAGLKAKKYGEGAVIDKTAEDISKPGVNAHEDQPARMTPDQKETADKSGDHRAVPPGRKNPL